jgi:hypothetical protein
VAGPTNKRLVLAAMIFAVAMTFIDQTIVAIAVPELQKDLSLSSTGVQWIVNGYLLWLSALFAFGGRLADIAGHKDDAADRGGRLRRRLGALWSHSHRRNLRGVDDHVPRRPRRICGADRAEAVTPEARTG